MSPKISLLNCLKTLTIFLSRSKFVRKMGWGGASIKIFGFFWVCCGEKGEGNPQYIQNKSTPRQTGQNQTFIAFCTEILITMVHTHIFQSMSIVSQLVVVFLQRWNGWHSFHLSIFCTFQVLFRTFSVQKPSKCPPPTFFFLVLRFK